jgi:5-hydroxyisourate hydrolase-like protein (transthyretin family)
LDILRTIYRATGDLDLIKQSGNTTITNNNSSYSLAGAEYGVYETNEDADADKNRMGTLITNTSGKSNKLTDLVFNTYYIKELTPPKGYCLDNTIYPVQINQANIQAGVVTAQRQDIPLSHTPDMLVQKLDTRTGKNHGLDDANGKLLAGAEFTVRYWDGYYNTINAAEASGAPRRTWVFVTKDRGVAKFSNEYLKSGSSPLYLDNQGSPVIPLGTIAIQETTPPKGYMLPSPNTPTLQTIKATGNTLQTVTKLKPQTIRETPHEAEVVKIDANTGKPIANTTFTLYKESSYSKGDWQTVSTRKTDAQGRCLFSPLATGSYKLKETRPNPKYQWPYQSGDVEEKSFQVTDTSGLLSIEFENHPFAEVDVEKYGKDPNVALGDTEFTIYCYPVEVVSGQVITDTEAIDATDEKWQKVSLCYGYDEFGSVVGANNSDKPLVDTVVTDSFGKAVFKDLPFGYYKLDETRPNPLYASLEESGGAAKMFKLEKSSTNEVQVFSNDLIKVSVEVYKKTIATTSSALDATSAGLGNNVGSEEYIYRFGARSRSNVRVDEFIVTDDLTYVTSLGYRMTTLWTGTSPSGMDNDGYMALLYKTNLTDKTEAPHFNYHPLTGNFFNPNNPDRLMQYSNSLGWRVWAEKLSVTEPTRLDVTDLNLKADEYIIGLKAVYGGVEKDFYCGKGWILEDDPHTVKDASALIDGEEQLPSASYTKGGLATYAQALEVETSGIYDWRYAVVATSSLKTLDEMGKENVMRGSVQANLARNFTPQGEAVLTDVDVDRVETRVIEPFTIDSKPWGLTEGHELISPPPPTPFAYLPFTGDKPLTLYLSLSLFIAGVLALGARLVAKKKKVESEKGGK